MRVRKASDLVSNGVILRAANKIVQSARSIASRKRAGKSARAIKLSTVREAKQTVSVSIILDTNIAPEAPAYEWGSGLHDTKGSPHYIDIDAVNAPNLVFMGTNEWEGQLIRVPHVNHPGVKPKPFIKPAVEKHRAALKRSVKEEVNKNLRVIIKSMAIKV